MLDALRKRDEDGRPIRVGVIGAGCMGEAIAYQISRTPGMTVGAVVDIRRDVALRAARHSGKRLVQDPAPATLNGPHDQVVVATDALPLLEGNPLDLDVLVEATNTVAFAASVVVAALTNRINVVLMNAELDLLLGPWLHELARQHNVGITSDAGDQHGVLMRMIDEIELWGFTVQMAGNIKGFLDRHATALSIAEEARKRALNPVQCVAYTDGTKLNIEMALVANAAGLRPFCRGMEGPRAQSVSEVFSKFDFERYHAGGVVDYLLGAEPGGGVFVVGASDDPFQQQYLAYYKMGAGPYYLFYRPYHLCHLETPYAIAALCLFRRSIVVPRHGKRADVLAVAKRDLAAGTRVTEAIGSDLLYGLIEQTDVMRSEGAVPVALLDCRTGPPCILSRPVRKDAPLTFADLELPESRLHRWCEAQDALLLQGSAALHDGMRAAR